MLPGLTGRTTHLKKLSSNTSLVTSVQFVVWITGLACNTKFVQSEGHVTTAVFVMVSMMAIVGAVGGGSSDGVIRTSSRTISVAGNGLPACPKFRNSTVTGCAAFSGVNSNRYTC